MGFWDGSTRALRVWFWGFCGAALFFGIRLLGEYAESDVLIWLSVVGMLGSVGVGFFAVLVLPFLPKR
jgi:hypothetical protein